MPIRQPVHGRLGLKEVTFDPIESPSPSEPKTAAESEVATTDSVDKLSPTPTRCVTVHGSALRLRFRDQRITVTIPYQHERRKRQATRHRAQLCTG